MDSSYAEDFDFEKTFERYLEAHREPHKERVIGEYYPSEIGNCLRKSFLNFLFPDKSTFDVKTLKIFFSGNMHHDHLVSKVLKWEFGDDVQELEKKVSISIYDGLEDYLFQIKGRVDNLLTFKDGNSIPIEVKTQWGSLGRKKEPSDHHVIQLYCYMAALGAKYGYLIYVERAFRLGAKDAVTTKTFKIDFDKKVWDMIIGRVAIIHKGLLNRTIPPAEAKTITNKKWQCKYCQHKRVCNNLEEGYEQIDEATSYDQLYEDLDFEQL